MNDPREREGTGTPAQERQAEVPASDGAGDAPERGRVPPPTPEEAPELLGERSDYPVPFGDES